MSTVKGHFKGLVLTVAHINITSTLDPKLVPIAAPKFTSPSPEVKSESPRAGHLHHR